MPFQLEDKLPFKVYGKLHIHNIILKEVQEANACVYFSEQEGQPLNGREGLQRAFLIENFYGLHILCNLFQVCYTVVCTTLGIIYSVGLKLDSELIFSRLGSSPPHTF